MSRASSIPRHADFHGFIFIFICLNGFHYYVLLEWAPALMGVSPSGCPHVFFSANKLSLTPLRRIHRLPQKNPGIARFFVTFISNSRYFGVLFNFTIYKTLKSSRCKLRLCALTPLSKLDTR